MAEADNKHRQEHIDKPPRIIGGQWHHLAEQADSGPHEYGVLLNAISDPVIIVDAGRNVHKVNQATINAFGFDPSGENLSKLAKKLKVSFPDGREVPLLKLPVSRALKGEEISAERYLFTNIHGREFITETSAKPVIINGQVMGVVIVWHDMTDFERAERVLRESDERYRALVNSLPQKIFFKNRDLVYISANDSYARDLKIKPGDINGKTDYDFFPRELADKYRADDKRVLESGNVEELEERYIQDGQERIVHTLKVPVRDKQGDLIGILGVFRDITERKQIEEALRESETKYRTLVEQIPALTYIADAKNPSHALYVSPQIQTLLGYTQDEFLHDPDFFLKHLHPDDRDRVLAEMSKIYTSNKPLIVEYRMLSRDQKVKWFHDEGILVRNEQEIPLFYQGVMFDITNQKKIEEALKNSEKQYRTLFESTGDAIFILETEGANPGRIISANQAAADMHDYTIDELLTLNMSDLDAPDDAEKALGRIDRIVQEGSLKFEAAHRKKDETRFYVEVRADLLELDNHKYVLAIDRDITDSKRAKELSDALNDINALINSTLDVDQITQRVLVDSTKAIGSETSAILLYEDNDLVVKYLYGLPQGTIGTKFSADESRLSALAAKARRPVYSNDAFNDERMQKKVVEQYNIRSFMAVPLLVKEESIGSLVFYYHSKPVSFTEAEIDFANKLATSISLAFENARLYASERRIADILQESLLILPEKIAGARYGHLYHSATETARVGGDFFDIFEIEHNKIGIIIGDVSGKGIEAANLTSLVKTTLKAHAFENKSPAIIMSKTNDLVSKVSEPSEFVTVFFGILETDTGELTYCLSGHPPAIIKRKESVELLSKHSPVIGVFPGMNYRSDKATLREGDVLVLYTDGIIEARRDNDFFGEDGLLSFIKSLGDIDPKNIPRRVFDEIVSFTGGVLSDDIAILAIGLER